MKSANKALKNRKPSPKKKSPPINKNPKVFEDAFRARLDLSPVDFIAEQVSAGSDVSAVRYLYDIMSAEIARKSNCICVGFDKYYQAAIQEAERMTMQKKTKVYNKLVRDKIPEIITGSGKTCTTEILSDTAYLQKLDEKLDEELAEYQKSKSLEELADLLEVMGAVVRARGYTWDDLTRIRKEKLANRGGFSKRILLKEVIDK